MPSKYNWTAIQSEYDSGLSQSDILKKYKMSARTLHTAKQKGIFKSRTVSDGVKLFRSLNPRTEEQNKKSAHKIALAVRTKVELGTWHTSLAKRMHIDYNGVDLHGSWELKYAQYLDYNAIQWQRNKDSFYYEFEGKTRKYTPDFYLPNTDEYVEIKGYKTAKDDAKWSQFPKHKKLVVLMEKDLKEMKIL